MMSGFVGMLLANENTSKTVDGLGALKGAPCVLESAIPFTDGTESGTELTFKWSTNSGNEETLSFKVYNGKDGLGTGGSGDGCTCEDIQDITEEEINDICKI